MTTAWLAVADRQPYLDQEQIVCPGCDHGDYDPLISAPDNLACRSAEERFDIVRCTRCELVYTNPRPTTASIAVYYPDRYEPHGVHKATSKWEHRIRARLEHAVLRRDYGHPLDGSAALNWLLSMAGRISVRSMKKRSRWIPFVGQGRLLDFGCGAGAFLQRMQRLGWSVEGLDASSTAASLAEQLTGSTVHVGSLPHPALARQQFDVVTMWASLEHVHQPRATIAAAREILGNNGLLVASVPNISSWGFRHFGIHWHPLDVPRHLTHFSPDTLHAMFEREGFEVLNLFQIGRDGWIRHSAALATEKEFPERPQTRFLAKPLSRNQSRWTERNSCADELVIHARKR